MREIPLTQGKMAQVSDEDYDYLIGLTWHVDKKGYAIASIYDKDAKKQHNRRMHRVIMGAETGEFVDHIDGNKLNNQRYNLRIVTQQQNLWNQKPRKSKSGYKGVTWAVNSRKWCAKLTCNGVCYYLGLFTSPEKAARAYNGKATELFGEYARLNEVPEEGAA